MRDAGGEAGGAGVADLIASAMCEGGGGGMGELVKLKGRGWGNGVGGGIGWGIVVKMWCIIGRAVDGVRVCKQAISLEWFC